MIKTKIFILLFIFLLCGTSVFAINRNSYSKYAKHIMPVEFDPFFINNFEACHPSDFVDWTGTYRYVVVGKNNQNLCEYKTQYNTWLKSNKNEWKDYKVCYFNDIQMNEITVALKESSRQVSSYGIGWYKVTGTKLEFLLSSYEYHGACKLVYKK